MVSSHLTCWLIKRTAGAGGSPFDFGDQWHGHHRATVRIPKSISVQKHMVLRHAYEFLQLGGLPAKVLVYLSFG